MRLLYINGELVDIDNDTSIGIDLQTYDIKNPAQRKVNISNEFTIPVTNKNLRIIGQLSNTQTQDKTIYDKSTCSYYINNVQYINDSRIKITQIADRITCYVFDKDDVWDLLKKETWSDFVFGYYQYLTDNGLPSLSNPINDTFSNIITDYTSEGGKHDVFLPYFRANELEDENEAAISGVNNLNVESGGHFCSFLKPVFKYIENKYSVDFNTSSSFSYNIFNDEAFLSHWWVFRDLYLTAISGIGQYGFKYYSGLILEKETSYLNTFKADETRDKTLYDFVVSIIQRFNLLVIPEDDSFKFMRLDDLVNMPVMDFSGKLDGVSKFKPSIEGYAQNNIIAFSSVETGINTLTNARTLTSLNKNLDESKELFKIDGFIPSFTDEGGSLDGIVPDLKTKDSFKDFKLFVNDGLLIYSVIKITANKGSAFEQTAVATAMYKPSLYSLNSEYTLLDNALDYPKYYEIKKWLTSTELHNFNFFRQYFIRELGGSYFINKIKGFNPELSKQAVTLEVFKISDQTPDSTFVINDVYVDGVENPFIDDVGNYYI